MKINIQSDVKASFKKVTNGFNEELFKALTPPLMKIEVLRFDGCEEGHEVHLKLCPFPYLMPSMDWVSKITENHFTEESWYFIDEGEVLPFPFKKWRHLHKVTPQKKGTRIGDYIDYSTGVAILDLILFPLLYFQLAYRKGAYGRFFQ